MPTYKNKIKKIMGTRKSLLARVQSQWVADRVMNAHPDLDLTIDVKGIITAGDQIVDLPLSQMEGKEFFVKELDQALLKGEVDFTVHSLKDLSTERPPGIIQAAIPIRMDPHDLIIWRSDVIDRLQKHGRLRIGTSAPRRLENIPAFLQSAIPLHAGKSLQIENVAIRGNVTTRLSKLKNENLDGVVLAYAGLARLWMNEEGRAELKNLLQETRWMVLPLASCPAAPAQGALAVECRETDSEMLRLLQPLHHTLTAQQVGREREILSDWGGGCHQSLGATAVQIRDQDLLFIRGRRRESQLIEEKIVWQNPPNPLPLTEAWDGMLAERKITPFLPVAASQSALNKNPALVFVSHKRALNSSWTEYLKKNQCRVWVPGEKTWKELAALGIWVEGCGDGLGIESTLKLMTSPLLQIPPFKDWIILTNAQSQSDWAGLGAHVEATYQVEQISTSTQINDLQKFSHFFWGSYSQFLHYRDDLPKNAHHACGMGATFDLLSREDLQHLHPFPSYRLWNTWILNLKSGVAHE